MRCPKCKADNPEGQQFCKKCGTALTEIPATLTSPPPEKEEAPKKSALDFTPGQYFGKRYQIIEEIGRGGMGRVYKALDKELNRTVALKMIKPELSSHPGIVERFKKEIKLASQIAHDNVCRIHDLGETEDIKYISMQFIEGHNLHEFIQASKILRVETALDITEQICNALTAAHKKGVIHRDLKPQNIMLDKKGNAYVMDFGIARSLEAEDVTKPGLVIGTPHYMSPEQAEGKKADTRSDIYSLGCIMYEMLTGKPPFKAETSAALIHKHITETPKPPSQINPQIPKALEEIILKCLEKKPEKRLQTADDITKAIDVEKPEFISVAKPSKVWKNSVAVLPFADMSPTKDQEYFCDGIAEELINSLTKINDLRVIARTSSFAFKGKQEDIREIGRKLDVETLLEGSVRKSGNRLRIAAQLVNVADGSHLWSERYDRDMDDIFAIQDEISLAIVDTLKPKLIGEEKAALVKHYTENLEAYNLYLQGRFYLSKLTPEGAEKGIKCFEDAIESDPTYALAYAGLSYIHGTRTVWGNIPPYKAIPIARQYVEKALEIDDTVAEAHGVLANICAQYDWNWPHAEQEYKRALALGPTVAQTHVDYSLFLAMRKRYKEAVAEARLAQKFDPLSTMINGWAGSVLGFAGQYEEAIKQLNKLLAMDPSYWNSHFMMSHIYSKREMLEEAMAEAEKAVDFSGRAPSAVMNLAYVCYLLDKRTKADKLFESLKDQAQHAYIPPMFFVWIHLARGEVDEAYKWLEKAYEDHDGWLCLYWFFPSTTPQDQRFTALLKKIDLE